MGWACGKCTFLNENDSASFCDVCQHRRRKDNHHNTKSTNNSSQPSEKNNSYTPAGTVVGKPKQMTLFGNFVDLTSEKNKKKKNRSKEKAVVPTTASSSAKVGTNPSTKVTVPEYAQFHLPYSTLAKQAREILENVFGFQELRGLQPQAVECALHRQSQIVVMATGGGKSLCYQLPALTLGGTTLVISPLKALIADQVQALLGRGVAAAFLSSQLTESAKTNVMERVLQRSLRGNQKNSKPSDCASWKGKYITLLYCTPEMLQTERFRASLLELHKSRRLTGFAVDEAHCVSSWG